MRRFCAITSEETIKKSVDLHINEMRKLSTDSAEEVMSVLHESSSKDQQQSVTSGINTTCEKIQHLYQFVQELLRKDKHNRVL